MTGAQISVTIVDKEVQRAFERLAGLMQHTRPVMAAIGVGLVSSTHMRFITQTDPDGQAWQGLSTKFPEYAANKRNTRILTESGRLRNSINSRPSDHNVLVGTNVIYAAAHQFGAVIKPKNASHLFFRIGGNLIVANSVTLPARPFLGISDQDEAMVSETVFDFVERCSSRP